MINAGLRDKPRGLGPCAGFSCGNKMQDCEAGRAFEVEDDGREDHSENYVEEPAVLNQLGPLMACAKSTWKVPWQLQVPQKL